MTNFIHYILLSSFFSFEMKMLKGLNTSDPHSWIRNIRKDRIKIKKEHPYRSTNDLSPRRSKWLVSQLARILKPVMMRGSWVE